MEFVTALRVNFSSTVIVRCGASFSSFRSLGGEKVTVFGVNDNGNGNDCDCEGDDDDDDNNNDITTVTISQCNLRQHYNHTVPVCPVLAK